MSRRNWTMKRATFSTWVALLVAALIAPLANASDPASVVRGARLYDNFSLELKLRTLNQPNPVFKTQQVRVAAPDTWRCVECHGWDYRGKNGVIGISGRQNADPATILAIL